VFAAVVQYARDRSAPARLAAAYAGMAVVLGALGIAEALSGPGSWLNMPGWVLDENPLVERAHGPFHPNLFAPYLSIALLLAGAHLRTWAARVPGWLVAAGGGLAAAALILTQSRTGWVAYAVALAVWSAVRARPRRVLAAAGLALVLAIGAAVAVPSLRGRLASMTAPWNAPSFQFRVQAFRFGLSLWAGHPLTGIGAGNYGVAFDRRLAAGAPNPGEGMRFHVHNFFLQTGLETGFVGLVAWLGVLGWLLVHFWGMRARAPGGAALGLGLLALFVAGNMLEVTVTQARGLMYAFGWGIAAAMGAGGTPRGAVAVRRTRGLS
jgi:putative inorganic carbon (HCO3(-)) transporter